MAATVDDLPRIMQSVAKRYGVKATCEAALKTIGYPATWIHTVAEMQAVVEYLSQ